LGFDLNQRAFYRLDKIRPSAGGLRPRRGLLLRFRE
jgi:hypothetical protein